MKFAQCCMHGKRRNLESLTEDGKGGYICIEESQCQMGAKEAPTAGPARGHCAVHGKSRSMICLEVDGSGGFKCKSDSPCKATGDEPSWKARCNSCGWDPLMMKGFGKGKKRQEGPSLSRTKVSEDRVTGTVLEWKGSFGWIKLTEPVEHPAASKHEGKVYIHKQDIVGPTALAPGATVHFVLFSDTAGLGAEQCSQLDTKSI